VSLEARTERSRLLKPSGRNLLLLYTNAESQLRFQRSEEADPGIKIRYTDYVR